MRLHSLVALAGFAATSCRPDGAAAPSSPVQPAAQSPSAAVAVSAVDVDSQPIDFYFREPRTPASDPSVFVIATSTEVGIQRVRDALSANGATPTNIRPLPQLPFHYE